jgi:hypothetical protein
VDTTGCFGSGLLLAESNSESKFNCLPLFASLAAFSSNFFFTISRMGLKHSGHSTGLVLYFILNSELKYQPATQAVKNVFSSFFFPQLEQYKLENFIFLPALFQTYFGSTALLLLPMR